MNWPVNISLFRTGGCKRYQMEKRRYGMASYTLCTRTFCMSACRSRGAYNCTGESGGEARISTAKTPEKLRQSWRCTLTADGIMNGQQSIFSKQQTTLSAVLPIAR